MKTIEEEVIELLETDHGWDMSGRSSDLNRILVVDTISAYERIEKGDIPDVIDSMGPLLLGGIIGIISATAINLFII